MQAKLIQLDLIVSFNRQMTGLRVPLSALNSLFLDVIPGCLLATDWDKIFDLLALDNLLRFVLIDLLLGSVCLVHVSHRCFYILLGILDKEGIAGVNAP